MYRCVACNNVYVWPQDLRRHMRHKHKDTQMPMDDMKPLQQQQHDTIVFQYPFTMMITGPSGSGKTAWTKQLLNSDFIHPRPQRTLYCYGQWQPLYNELQRELSSIEFIKGIPDRLTDPDYVDGAQRVVIVFDDLMTEAKCDQRIADLFTKWSHHRNMSVMYLTQNVFPQGKACQDIALNTQYLTLFNNPIDRQQVATLARRIYPTSSALFITRFEDAVRRPYGYLVVDLRACTPEHDRLHTDIFKVKGTKMIDDTGFARSSGALVYDNENDEDEDDDNSVISSYGEKIGHYDATPGKRKYVVEEWNAMVCPLGQRHHKAQRTSENALMYDINHKICPAAYMGGEEDCYLKRITFDQAVSFMFPDFKRMAQETYPYCYPDLAERRLINDNLSHLRKVARVYLYNALFYMSNSDNCPMYSMLMTIARRLSEHSQIPNDMAIQEAIRMCKDKLDPYIVEEQSEEEEEEEEDKDSESDGHQLA